MSTWLSQCKGSILGSIKKKKKKLQKQNQPTKQKGTWGRLTFTNFPGNFQIHPLFFYHFTGNRESGTYKSKALQINVDLRNRAFGKLPLILTHTLGLALLCRGTLRTAEDSLGSFMATEGPVLGFQWTTLPLEDWIRQTVSLPTRDLDYRCISRWAHSNQFFFLFYFWENWKTVYCSFSLNYFLKAILHSLK